MGLKAPKSRQSLECLTPKGRKKEKKKKKKRKKAHRSSGNLTIEHLLSARLVFFFPTYRISSRVKESKMPSGSSDRLFCVKRLRKVNEREEEEEEEEEEEGLIPQNSP